MRRGTTLAPDTIAQRLQAAGHGSPSLRPGWDKELTELDLRLDVARLVSPPAPAIVRIEPPSAADDDLPMLDDSEFVVALQLDDLAPVGSRKKGAPSAPKRRRSAAPANEAPQAWVTAVVVCTAMMIAAWVVGVLRLI